MSALGWAIQHIGKRAAPQRKLELVPGGDGLGAVWLERYFALRRLGLVMPILKLSGDGRSYFVARNLIDLWHDSELVSVAELRKRIQWHECALEARKAGKCK